MIYRWEHPEYLWALALPLLLLLLQWAAHRWRIKQRARFAESHLFYKVSQYSSLSKSWWRYVLRLFAFSLLVLAIANPQKGSRIEKKEGMGTDIVFVLDISLSMLAEDVSPDRLSKAKNLAFQTLSELDKDRFGLVVYAGKAFPQVPITGDHSLSRVLLKQVSPDMISAQGTNINEALTLAASFFNPKSLSDKLIFLISDGEDHEGNIDEAVKGVKEAGAQVFSIGIGTAQGGPIPITERGTPTYKKDAEGNVVVTRLDESVLKKIAEQTGGAYLLGNNSSNALSFIKENAGKAKKTSYEKTYFSEYQSIFIYPLALSLLLWIFDLFMLDASVPWLTLLKEKFNPKNA